MPSCSNCGAELTPSQKFCNSCGTPVARATPAPTVCPGCQQAVTAGTKFCPNCGTPLTSGAVPTTVQSSSPPLVSGPPSKPMKITPTEEEQEQEANNEPLLTVDFSAQNPFPDDSRRFYLEENEYHIFNRQGEPGAVTLFEQQLFDGAQLTSHLRRLSGVKDGGYGVVCLARDNANFYCLLVSANRNYCLSRLEQNQWSDLVGWTLSENIYGDQDENELRVDVYPTMVRIWVNGYLLDVLRSDFPKNGKVGLIVANPNLHIACRTFEVKKPPKL